MSTTIKSTGLDFESIKSNLKTFLAEKPEFTDYNFEASALANVLDVLAYNTHYNALTANFALNESFLGTAQLRSSLVSLSEGIGYIPDSQTAARASINISANLAGIQGRDSTIQIPAGLKFEATVDDIGYVFQTRESIRATDDGNGIYNFVTIDGNPDITVYEGTQRTKTFLVGPYQENVVFIIPDRNMDIDTSIIRVYQTATSSEFATYSNILSATTISDVSTLYVLKEAPNEYFELSFGNGTTLGIAPVAGNKVTVDYLSTNGAPANGANTFIPTSKLNVEGQDVDYNITTVSLSAAGAPKESIESIRANSPFQYASQNRMVTAGDYASLVLRNFSSLINDIIAWGGEDNLYPEYGVVFLSVLFNDDVPTSTIASTKDQIIELAKQLSVITFDLKFSDPNTTYIETSTFFQFNPSLTTLSLNAVQNQVQDVINEYFATNVGKFEQSFRRSNMLTLVDAVSPAVLSSRAEVRMQQRITPILAVDNDFSLRYPVPIATPDDEFYRVTSTSFTYQNKICIIKNALSSTKLQIIDLNTNDVVIDNIGAYNPTTGDVNIVGFVPQLISGGLNYLKITVLPANQSAVSPVNNDVLTFDEDASVANGVTVSSN